MAYSMVTRPRVALYVRGLPNRIQCTLVAAGEMADADHGDLVSAEQVSSELQCTRVKKGKHVSNATEAAAVERR